MAPKVCECCGQVVPSYYEDVAHLAKLTPMQGRLFLALAAKQGTAVSWQTIINAIYFDDIEGGPLNARRCVHVMRCYANKKIARFGLQISTAYGAGYRLEVVEAAKEA